MVNGAQHHRHVGRKNWKSWGQAFTQQNQKLFNQTRLIIQHVSIVNLYRTVARKPALRSSRIMQASSISMFITFEYNQIYTLVLQIV